MIIPERKSDLFGMWYIKLKNLASLSFPYGGDKVASANKDCVVRPCGNISLSLKFVSGKGRNDTSIRELEGDFMNFASDT